MTPIRTTSSSARVVEGLGVGRGAAPERQGSPPRPDARAFGRASCGRRRGRGPSDRRRRGSSPSRSSGRPAGGCRPAPRTRRGWPGTRSNTGDSKSLPAIRPMSPQRESASRSSATAPRRPADLPRRVHPAVRLGGADADRSASRSSAGAAGSGGSRSSRSPWPQPSASGAPPRRTARRCPAGRRTAAARAGERRRWPGG